ISEQPDVYITTGIAKPGEEGIVIGQQVYTYQTQESLAKHASRAVVSPLNAVKENRVYAMWHLFYDSPLNIAAVEAIAKWTHPELFGKLQPHGVLKEINERFLAVPLKGVYFAELKKVGKERRCWGSPSGRKTEAAAGRGPSCDERARWST